MPNDPAVPPDAASPGTTPSDSPERPAASSSGILPRRDFLRVAGATAGLAIVGATPLERGTPNSTSNARATAPASSRRATSPSPEVVVIGAGAWGSFTAYNLVKRGLKVTLVDAYGPGNGRSTSGDETRGVRSSYGDRVGVQGEQWMLWAREAMKKWTAFDDEWGRTSRLNLFHRTGDLIMRAEWDSFQLRTKVWWEKNNIPFEVLNPDDVRKAFPVISMDDITAVLYEPDAGVVRARRATQAAANAFETLGGKIVIGRAEVSKIATSGRLDEVRLDTGQTLRADTFVWAVGPWMAKTFPALLGNKARAPMGYVCYFATPVNDERFTFPNLPSYNFPGVTGWAALPVDNRGFRVRGTERAPTPPPTAADSAAGRAGAADTTGRGAGRGRGGGGRGGGRGRGAAADSGRASTTGRGGSDTTATAGRGRGRGGTDSTAAAGRGGRGGGGGGGGGRGGGGGQNADTPASQLDPDLSDRWADQTRVDGSRRFVAHRFPLMKDAPITQTHSCHYESTSSGNFIIDRHPDMSNAWIVAGGNSEGFKMSPVVGEYAALRIMGITGDPALVKAFKIPATDYGTPTGGPPGDDDL